MTLRSTIRKAIKEQRMSDPIGTLMSRAKLNWNWKVESEQAECIVFADMLRVATKDGRLKAIWCHCPNESKRSVVVAMILKAMGLIPGAPDYWIVGANKAVLIEFKRPDKDLPPDFKDNQKLFQFWAGTQGVPLYMHNKAEDAMETLRMEGLLS